MAVGRWHPKTKSIDYLKVLSQLPVTKQFISEIHASSLTGASCIATVVAWPPEINGHIFTCLSQPPENTVVPSSFQVEHNTFHAKFTLSITLQVMWKPKKGKINTHLMVSYRLIMWYWCLSYAGSILKNFPAPNLSIRIKRTKNLPNMEWIFYCNS